MTFDLWMDEVDQEVCCRTAVSVHDLPDICFHDYYDDGMTPSEVAQIVIENGP